MKKLILILTVVSMGFIFSSVNASSAVKEKKNFTILCNEVNEDQKTFTVQEKKTRRNKILIFTAKFFLPAATYIVFYLTRLRKHLEFSLKTDMYLSGAVLCLSFFGPLKIGCEKIPLPKYNAKNYLSKLGKDMDTNEGTYDFTDLFNNLIYNENQLTLFSNRIKLIYNIYIYHNNIKELNDGRQRWLDFYVKYQEERERQDELKKQSEQNKQDQTQEEKEKMMKQSVRNYFKTNFNDIKELILYMPSEENKKEKSSLIN